MAVVALRNSAVGLIWDSEILGNNRFLKRSYICILKVNVIPINILQTVTAGFLNAAALPALND
jgi:hypothetical protein